MARITQGLRLVRFDGATLTATYAGGGTKGMTLITHQAPLMRSFGQVPSEIEVVVRPAPHSVPDGA